MPYIETLLHRNRDWVSQNLAQDSDYYHKHSQGQSPKVLWLGCSDSRVSPEEITGSGKGELFVHRNIANLVLPNDFNFLSVLEYALVYLKVEHVVVCGHYGCGGVQAAMKGGDYGLINHWIQPIKDTYRFFYKGLAHISEEKDRLNQLIEHHTIEQVLHLGQLAVVARRWEQGPPLSLHAWVYDLEAGYLKKLIPDVNSLEALDNLRPNYP